jgi:predicted  nucleic acid-binding Zn-ribbon protein
LFFSAKEFTSLEMKMERFWKLKQESSRGRFATVKSQYLAEVDEVGQHVQTARNELHNIKNQISQLEDEIKSMNDKKLSRSMIVAGEIYLLISLPNN